MKKNYFDKLAEKLKNINTKSKNWWKILKSFIKTPDKSIIAPLKQNDEIYANDKDKANVLSSYFKS